MKVVHGSLIAVIALLLTMVSPASASRPASEVDRWSQRVADSHPADPVPDSDPAVSSLAMDQGISAREANRRLAWQQQAPALAEAARALLGERFGGLWIDQTDGGRVHVAKLPGSDDRQLAQVVRAAMPTNSARIVEVDHSEDELISAQDWAYERLEEVNAGASWPLDVYLSSDTNSIVFEVPIDGALTAEQEAVYAEALIRYGSMIGRETYDGQGVPDSCNTSNNYCSTPLRAGVPIDTAGTCTAAFHARSNSDSKPYILTAGHCIAGHGTSTNWTTKHPGSATNWVIGRAHNWKYDSTGDVGIIRNDYPNYWGVNNLVLVQASGSNGGVAGTTRDTRYRVTAALLSQSGARVCMSGRTTGTSCGEVKSARTSHTYGGVTVQNLVRATYCRGGGDSGGPVYAYQRAHGIHVAGRTGTTCGEAYYEHLTYAQADMRVTAVYQ